MKRRVIAFEIRNSNFQDEFDMLKYKLDSKIPFLILLHRNINLDYCDEMISNILNKLRVKFPNAIIREIPQKSLSIDSYATLEVHCIDSDSIRTEPEKVNNAEIFSAQDSNSKFCCIVTSHSGVEKYSNCFESISNGLQEVDLKYTDIIRQWNYLPNIFEIDESGNEEYATFNTARSKVYLQTQMKNYPAATGIGVDGDNSIIIVFAEQNSESKIFAVENPLQVSAYKYSNTVLKQCDNSTVKQPLFSRGLLIVQSQELTFYISGTASIRGELTVGDGSVAEQAERTIENIVALTDESNIAHFASSIPEGYTSEPYFLKVYLQDKSGIGTIQNIIQNKFRNADVIFVHSNICRKELLVEIEGII